MGPVSTYCRAPVTNSHLNHVWPSARAGVSVTTICKGGWGWFRVVTVATNRGFLSLWHIFDPANCLHACVRQWTFWESQSKSSKIIRSSERIWGHVTQPIFYFSRDDMNHLWPPQHTRVKTCVVNKWAQTEPITGINAHECLIVNHCRGDLLSRKKNMASQNALCWFRCFHVKVGLHVFSRTAGGTL